MRETPVRSLAWEDPLEKEMATHSSIPAWRIPWTEEPCRLQSMGSQRVGHDWVASLHFTLRREINWFKARKIKLMQSKAKKKKKSTTENWFPEKTNKKTNCWLNGHEFEQTPGDSEGQRNLAAIVRGVTKIQTRLTDWKTTADKREKSPKFCAEKCYRLIFLYRLQRECGHQEKLSRNRPFQCIHIYRRQSTFKLIPKGQ